MKLKRIRLDSLRSEAEGDPPDIQSLELAPLGFYTADIHRSGVLGTRYGYTRYQMSGAAPAAGGPHNMSFGMGLQARPRPWSRFPSAIQIVTSDGAVPPPPAGAFANRPNAASMVIYAVPAQHDGDGQLGPPEVDLSVPDLDTGTIIEAANAGDVSRGALGADDESLSVMELGRLGAVQRGFFDIPILSRRAAQNAFRSLTIFLLFQAVPDNALRGFYVHALYSQGERRWPEGGLFGPRGRAF